MKSKQHSRIKFGTDGWRAIMAKDFTFENVAALSQAVCDYFKKVKKNKGVRAAIGFDTRFLSKDFAREALKVLVANKIKVQFSDRAIPTPALSFAVKDNLLDFGIMITASHNPPEFNGFKIKDNVGAAVGSDITSIVEKLIFKNKIKRVDLRNKKYSRYFKMSDFSKGYLEFLRKYVDLKIIRSSKLKVLIDVMHGSGNGFMVKCVGRGRIRLNLIREDVNPSFDGSRPEPLPENLELMISKMKKERFDIGLVLDGDADRIAALDSNGQFISPQIILCLLILHLVKDRGESGAVVKTVVGTSMIDRICQRLDLDLYETPVGFKYISALMKERDIIVGGEEAGGIGFKDYIPERDGILAGLLLLEMLAKRGCSIDKLLKELKSQFGNFYYTKDSIKITHVSHFSLESIKIPHKILGQPVVEINRKDGLKLVCQDESWLMLRGSGTEPIVRIYAEAHNEAKAKRMISLGKKMIKS